MAKPGRNEPCPCGSGKKYKQCCLDSKVSPLPTTQLAAVFSGERAKAEALVRGWMGESGEDEPLRDRHGRRLMLVMDRFTVSRPEVFESVAKLGQPQEQRVLFFDGKRWIGEADFSNPGEMVLLTPAKELSARLVALLKPLSGLKHEEQKVDDLGALELSSDEAQGGSLLGFKTTFFRAWLDEPNQKLGELSPRQASTDPQMRAKLLALITQLEAKEAKLSKSERFSFRETRAELGL